MKKLVKLINSRLWIKVLIPVSMAVILVMTASLWYSIVSQKTFAHEQLASQNKILALAVEGGMFDALAIGDNDTVRNQFRQLNEKVQNLKVYVYDFNGVVSFSTDINAVGRTMDAYTNAEGLSDINEMLASGNASGTSLKMVTGDEGFVIKNEPILNERKCFHCHGRNREVLGGISVLSSMTAMQESIRTGRNTSIMISVAGLAVIIFLVWLIFVLLVNKKVSRVMTATSRMRQKDFTHQTMVGRGDEISHILNRINMVTGELRTTIRSIVENSHLLEASSHKMNDIAHTLDASSTEASQKASNVSAAAEEMSANNTSIATAMDDAAESMNALAAAVDEMSATVGEIARNSSESKHIIERVVDSFTDILSAVEELGVRAEDVDEVTNEIRSISEQVSLLALNAKIEAARAGDAGKGFAVVAQEITELAQDTNRSTVDADEKLVGIKTTVQELIGQVSALAGDVRTSDDAISGIAAAVEEQNVTTSEIAKSINEVSGKISEVNASVTQGAQVASEIAKDIVGVEAMSAKVQEESHTLNTGAEDLAKMAESFAKMMKAFKV
ncbi:MAG TPA: hypothetical protein DHV36_14795 [Desulfobacteraceae bacterium]|nr:hypothetical protein [Desulfobacteraceae bacterium]